MKKIFFFVLIFTLSSGLFAQSKLKPCPKDQSIDWNNCFGKYTIGTGKNKGASYEGEIKKNMPHGQGTYFHADGDKYVGEFKDGVPSGQGTYFYATGDKYVGEFKDGESNGQGTYYYLADNEFKGDKYVGEYKDDKRNGQGTYFHANGNKYVGEYKDDKRNGQGTYFHADGDKYVGEFKNGKSNGQGTFFFANGDKYVGEFKDDKRNGQGTYYRVDGRVGLGEWKEGKPHGRFVEYKSDKSVERSGIFEEGKLVQSQYIDPKSFSSIAQNSVKPPPADNSTAEKEQLERERQRLAEERRRLEEEQDKVRKQQAANQTNPAPHNINVGKRIALVIGNAKYQLSPLKNPINDANDISSALKLSGFEVIDVRDANLQQMRSAVRSFGDRLLNSDVGLVYYSGHGIESKGRNYFIPVNTDIQRDDEIADQALDVNLILDKMTTAGKGVNILIVDACRNDPFTRSFRTTSKGLAAMDAPKGTIIAYSTSPGKVASDGDPKARNSPYTKHLLAAMQVPNRPIELVFKEVRRNVQNDTKNEQTPWENTSLSGDFYFKIQQ
jgi:hypothetical protein